MSEQDQRWWDRARQARAQLETLVISHPEVRMVGIGIDPEQQGAEPVLIVTIQHGAAVPTNVPKDIAGIPVRVVYGDYQLEQGE
jgi:hypothetical protein